MACSQASQYRRTVVLDIETVSSDPNNEKGALSALTGRIVCIALLIDDRSSVSEISLADVNQRALISLFWETVKPSEVIVGHNVLDFDLVFIRQRSWILNLQPSLSFDTRKYYTSDVVDTLQLWSNWGKQKGATLENLGAALGCGSKCREGEKVAEWWTSGDLDSIKTYCQQNVRLAYNIFGRLTFRQSSAPTERWTTPRLDSGS